MQLDNTPRQREAEAETAAFAFGSLLRLEEELENARCGVRVHARAVVAHREFDRVRARIDAHIDAASDDRVLYGVRHEIAHDLHDARAVGVHPGGSALQPHLSAGRDAGGGERPQGLVDCRKHVDRATLQRNLARNGAPHVEQVLDDAGQVRRLSRDHVLGELPLRIVRPRALQQVYCVRDRGQRVAELVAEHREKLVLRAARLRDLGERLLEFRGARGGTRLEQ